MASIDDQASRDNRDRQQQQQQQDADGNFECNICLDTAKDAVVSMCGHLFWLVRLGLAATNSLLLVTGVPASRACWPLIADLNYRRYQ